MRINGNDVRDDSNLIYASLCRREAMRREMQAGIRAFRPSIERRPPRTLREVEADEWLTRDLAESVVTAALVLAAGLALWAVLG